MSWIPFMLHWDEGNTRSATAQGISMADCNYAMKNLLQFFDTIWEDTTGSKKEKGGVKRYVAIGRTMSGDRIFICFTCGRLTWKGEITAVAARVIGARPVHRVSRKEAILRQNPPKRFRPAPSLQEIFGVGIKAV